MSRQREFELSQSEESELKSAFVGCRDGATRTRYQAVRLYGSGYSTVEIEGITGCSWTSLMEWCRNYREQGLAGLEDHRLGGNHAYLTPEQVNTLEERLHDYSPQMLFGSTTHTLDGQFWTVEDLARGVKQWYGVSYKTRVSYQQLLKRCGFTYQRTEKVYKSRREQDVLDFEAALEKK